LTGGGVVAVIGAAVTTALVVSLSGQSLPANPCDMLSSSTVATYAQGQACQHDRIGQSSGANSSGQATRNAHWGGVIVLEASLFSTSTAAQQDYTSFHGILQAGGQYFTVTDHRDVSDVGDRALVVYQADNNAPDSAGATVLVLAGKAVIRLDYFATLPAHGDARGAPLPQGRAEDDALALARDVLDQLG
jgi:hypothetical protein